MMEKPPTEQSIAIDGSLARAIQETLGQNVYLCYQCIKCSAGCPLSEYFDWQPNQIMRAVQLGEEEIAFKAQTPWLCASCQTCSTRCPQGLDIAAIMDYLTRESLAQGYAPPVSEVKIFNEAFMRELRLWGRSYELGLLAEMKIRTGDLFSDLDLGMHMLQKGKMPFLPHYARPPRKVKRLPEAADSVAYYPGCSLHSTSPEFDHSTRAICEALDIRLVEPDGWICCGSSAAHRTDPEAALRLPMENLSLIEQSGFREVTMPCAACFNRHKAAQHEIRLHEHSRRQVAKTTGYRYQDQVQVNTLADTLLERAGKEKIAARVTQPLQGLKVVTYYGCLLTRPPQVTEAEQPENPIELDEIVRALGAEVRDWSYKTTCCGATHSLTRPDIVLKLSGSLIEHARQAGADLIVVACPLCHTNLDARQFQMTTQAETPPAPMPVLYFTQLMALAFGLPQKAAALQKNMVDPWPVLEARGIHRS